jgi:WD40 repeat protein
MGARVMKYRLVGLLLLFLLNSHIVIQAQSEDRIAKRFEVTAPSGYESGNRLSWSPDGTLVAISFTFHDESYKLFEESWQVYDVQTGELVNEFFNLIAWSADSRRLVVRRAENALPQILDAHTGALLGTLENAGSTFAYDMVRSPSIFILTGDVIPNLDRLTNILRFYNAQTGALLHTLPDVLELPVYTHDLSRFAVSTTIGVQIYDAASFIPLHTLERFLLSDYQLSWSPDDQHLLVKPQDAHYRLGPLHIWTPDGDLSAPIYNVTSRMVWSPDSSTLAAPSDYSKIRLYDADSGELVETIRGFSEGGLYAEQWYGTYLISISGNYQFAGVDLNVWNTETHSFIFQGSVDVGYQYRLQDNILEIYQPFVGLRQIDITTGETVQELTFEQPFLFRSPDRRWLIRTDFPGDSESSPAPVFVYQAEPLELVATLQGHIDMVRYIDWSPDSRHFASIGMNNVIVWEVVKN